MIPDCACGHGHNGDATTACSVAGCGCQLWRPPAAPRETPLPTPVAATAFYQGDRVFLRIGNYEFEILVPPILREHGGDQVEVARNLSELVDRCLTELVMGIA